LSSTFSAYSTLPLYNIHTTKHNAPPHIPALQRAVNIALISTFIAKEGIGNTGREFRKYGLNPQQQAGNFECLI
jgi:hypothetical protein